MLERSEPKVQLNNQTQTAIAKLRSASANWYRTAFLFLVLGSTALIGGLAAGQEFKKVKTSHVDEAAIATGISLLAGTLLVSGISVNLNIKAEMKENHQKVMDEINSHHPKNGQP